MSFVKKIAKKFASYKPLTQIPADSLERLAKLTDELHDRDLELRESEMRYRMLFWENLDAVVLIDPETHMIVDFNDAACKSLGYSAEEFKHIQVPDFEAIESEEEYNQHCEKVKERGGDAFFTKHKKKDGTIVPVKVITKYICVNDQDVIQSIWRYDACTDTTT